MGLWVQRSGVKEVKSRREQRVGNQVAEMNLLGLEKRRMDGLEVKEQGSWE